MSMSQAIDNKLFAAIGKLNDEQKQEVLAFVDGFSENAPKLYDKWKDESFVAEMDSRYNYYLNGGKMVSPEEAEDRINKLRERLRNK